MGKLFALSVEELDQVRVFLDGFLCCCGEFGRGARFVLFEDYDVPCLIVVLEEGDFDPCRLYCFLESLIYLDQDMALRDPERFPIPSRLGFPPAGSLPNFAPRFPVRVNADCREALIVLQSHVPEDGDFTLRDPIRRLGDSDDGPLAVRDFRPAALSADVLPPH